MLLRKVYICNRNRERTLALLRSNLPAIYGLENLIRRSRMVLPTTFLFACLRMCHDRCLHPDAHVRTLSIVEFDYTLQFLLAVLPCWDVLLVKPFCLKYTVSPLCHCIFQGGTTLCHTDAYVVFFQFLHIYLTAILASTVRVMYKHGSSLVVYRGEGHSQRLQRIESFKCWS